MIAILQEAARQ